jgi:LmbE family N-acetylglucosaminyl deacetylase
MKRKQFLMSSKFEPFLDKTRPLFFRSLLLSPTLRAVVLAPHPDDFDAIGITMHTLQENGNPIDVAVLTSGASGVEDDFAPQLTNQGKAALREQEQAESCQFFGLPPERLTFLRLAEDAEGHLEVSEQNLARLKAYWHTHLPDLVFLPHGNDTNAGHQRTYRLFRRLKEAEPRRVMVLLNRDPKTIEMRQDLYTVFTETEALWKGTLLRFHRTQHERNLKTRQHGIDERILRVNRQVARGLGGAAAYAEVFELEG